MILRVTKPALNLKVAFFLTIFGSMLTSISILALEFYIGDLKQSDSRLLILNRELKNNISCHFITDNNVLPTVEDVVPRPNSSSIFFHETSCIGGLDSRKACAIESAARLHPNRSIYVFFNSPISETVLNETSLSILSQFPNIRFARLFSAKHAEGTRLKDILALGGNTGTPWLVQHTADMLRFITLYKYGGIYLDTDLIVVKPLDALGENWAVRETDTKVNIAAMSFSTNGVGKSLTGLVINDIVSSYRPDLWDYNGSGALIRSLRRICRIFQVTQMNRRNCKGFHLYNSTTLYPVHWFYTERYFKKDTGYLQRIIENEDKVYGHHLWNKLSMNYVVEKDSPFEKLARKYCPSIREVYGNQFGN